MERLVSLLGLVAMIALAWTMSPHKRKFSIRVVLGGLLLQFSFAVLIIRTSTGRWIFRQIGIAFAQLEQIVGAGTGFVFGIHGRADDPPLPPAFTLLRTFAFNVLPTIIFVSALMSVLYHWGVMQRVVAACAWLMKRTLRTSGAESLSAAANIFVGPTEAPLVVRPYINGMTMSELNAMMVGGFSTIAGSMVVAYSQMGIDAGHLVTASVVSAPAALLIAKVMYPETSVPETLEGAKIAGVTRSVNSIDALAIGTTDGLRLAVNVGAMLIVFIALIALANAIIGGIGAQFGFHGEDAWSLELGLRYVFAPLAWLIGIPRDECLPAGELLGIKTVANEFIAYQRLGQWTRAGSQIQISDRSAQILTYALAGFANFGTIGIQIGGIGVLAPQRRGDLARLGLRAMIGGMLACFMTACVAALLI